MSKVAREGDVSATPGTTPFTGAQSGVWTVGAITYSLYDKIVSGGQKAISQAQCTFTFSGANASGTTVTGSETLTLAAQATTLQKQSSGVVVDGDSTTSSFGNTLRASSSEKLGTS